MFGLAVAAVAQPSSPACVGALERISQAQKVLVPFRRTLEMARAHEHGASGEASACIVVSRRKEDKSLRCREVQWRPPSPTKYDLAAVDQYRQERQAFADLFNQTKQVCLLRP